jgi:hypothetical protein
MKYVSFFELLLSRTYTEYLQLVLSIIGAEGFRAGGVGLLKQVLLPRVFHDLKRLSAIQTLQFFSVSNTMST